MMPKTNKSHWIVIAVIVVCLTAYKIAEMVTGPSWRDVRHVQMRGEFAQGAEYGAKATLFYAQRGMSLNNVKVEDLIDVAWEIRKSETVIQRMVNKTRRSKPKPKPATTNAPPTSTTNKVEDAQEPTEREKKNDKS